MPCEAWRANKKSLGFLEKPQTTVFLVVGNGETPIFHVKIWNHPIETTILIRGWLGFQDDMKCADSNTPTTST